MWKWFAPLALFSLLAGFAQAAESSRIQQAVQGAAGAAISLRYVHEFAPERTDLARHAIAGGAIATVIGSLTERGYGWKAGVIIGAGKEIVNDALLDRGHPQFDDFAVTAGAAVLSSCLSTEFMPVISFDGRGAGVQFRYAF